MRGPGDARAPAAPEGKESAIARAGAAAALLEEGKGGRLPPVIRKRRDFLACARARKWVAPGVVVQGRARSDGEGPRVGFTCSRKIGKAVERNRAKRRLREAARAAMPGRAREGWDYVLIGRPGATLRRPFASLVRDVETALDRLHRPKAPQDARDAPTGERNASAQRQPDGGTGAPRP